jgi:hypothetical protein
VESEATNLGQVTGVIVSSYAKDYRGVDVVTIGIDASGRIVGGASGSVDFVPANGKASFSLYYQGAKPANTASYGQISDMTLLMTR